MTHEYSCVVVDGRSGESIANAEKQHLGWELFDITSLRQSLSVDNVARKAFNGWGYLFCFRRTSV